MKKYLEASEIKGKRGMKMVKTRITEWNTTDKLLMIQGWARDGLTNQQIAHNMGIHHDTLHRWSKKDKSIYDALKRAKKSLTERLRMPYLNVQ